MQAGGCRGKPCQNEAVWKQFRISNFEIQLSNLNQMATKESVSNVILRQGILPLYFNADETVSVEVLRAIHKAGIKAVEYTNRGEAALRNFRRLVTVRNNEMSGMLLGIGTIKSSQE